MNVKQKVVQILKNHVSFPLSTMASPILSALCLTVINFGALQRLIIIKITPAGGEKDEL